MRILRLITVLVVLSSPLPAAPSPVDSLLAVGSDTTADFETRREAIRQAVRIDETGRAEAARARLLMDHPSPDRMVAAEHALKRAMRQDRENVAYVGLMARLMWKIGRRGSSLDYAERAVETDPDHPVGHYWAGRYHFWETMKYLWMRRIEINQDSRGYERPHEIDLGSWGEEARQKAESAFGKVLALDPTHVDARRYLGLIYYQTHRATNLRDLYKPVLKQSPDDPTAYFTIGMSYQLDRDQERAYQAYNRGLHLMAPSEQHFMLSVFTSREAGTTLTPPDTETLQRFWTGKNPLFLSPVNERMLEQCRRVAYVNLRYGDPEKGIPGWTTDRGQAYIRYGDPLVLQSRPPEIDTNIDDPIIAQRYRFNDSKWFGTSGDQYTFGKELWEYENFILVFDNTDTRDAWRFRIAALDGAIIDLDDLVARVPDRFVDPFANRRFPINHQLGQFRGPGGKSRIELYYAVPVSKVESETNRGLGKVDLEKGLFLFDAQWDTVDIQKAPVDRLAWIKDGSMHGGYLLSGEVLNLRPGNYHLAAEVIDNKSKRLGGFRTPLAVRRFSHTELDISSILLARRVIEKPDRPFGRDRFVILPNPLLATPRSRKAYFYFEVYNLQRDPFGRTSYEVTYQTKPVPEGDFETEPEWTTAVTQEVAGDHAWEPVYLALDLEGAQPGLRDFRVIVRDKHSDQQATVATQYRIRW